MPAPFLDAAARHPLRLPDGTVHANTVHLARVIFDTNEGTALGPSPQLRAEIATLRAGSVIEVWGRWEEEAGEKKD